MSEQPEMLTDDHRCGQCGQPVTSIEAEPLMEGDYGNGYIEALAVGYELKPCGHVYRMAIDRPAT